MPESRTPNRFLVLALRGLIAAALAIAVVITRVMRRPALSEI